MAKILIVSEEDFKPIEIDVDDEQLKVAEEVREYFETDMSGIMFSDDGKTMKIRHQVKERFPGEKDTHAYLITITKIPFQ